MKNVKTFKKLFAGLLAGCMVAGCLTGCGDNAATSESTSKETTVTQESPVAQESTEVKEEVKEVVPLTYWVELDAAASQTLTSLNEVEMLQQAQEKTYVDVTYSHPATGTVGEQFNLKLSNLEFEDIIEYNWQSYAGGPAQAIEDGVIVDLTPYLEAGAAPNFKKYLDENPDVKKQISTDSGQIYAFPAIATADGANVTSGYYVRTDLLEKVGLDKPETIADWEEMLTAFKDQLGMKAPFTGQASHLVGGSAWFAGAFDTFAGFYVRDGKVQYGYIEDNFGDYIATMAKWYKDGLIDQDAFGNDGNITKSNILNDDAGSIFGFIGSLQGSIIGSAAETNPTLKLEAVPYPVGKEGETSHFINRSWEVRAAGMAAITTACKDVEAAMRYLDYFYSEEGALAKNFGVEGVSYNMVNGSPVYTDTILKNPEGLSITAMLGKYTRASNPSVGLIDIRYYEGYYTIQEQVDALYLWNADTVEATKYKMPAVTATSDESEELAAITTALNTYVQEECTKFIMGLRDINEWDDFVATVKGMNVDRAIEINQAAYDRYMAR